MPPRPRVLPSAAARLTGGLVGCAALLALAGCTSSGVDVRPTVSRPASPTGTPTHAVLPAVNVCDVVDASALSLALGQRFDEGVATPATRSTMGQCDFTAGKTGVAPIKHVYIAARPVAAFDQLAQFYPSQPVPGVGEAAVFGANIGLLVRIPGKPYFLQITAADATGDLVQAQAVAIARVCLGRF